MATLNRVELIGRLTRDPEMRYTPSGVPVANLSLAVNSAFTRDGQRQERADFFDIVAWQQLGLAVGEHLRKGSLVLVAGRLQLRTWDAQDGSRRKAVEVVAQDVQFLDRAPARDGASPEPAPVPDDDDIPF